MSNGNGRDVTLEASWSAWLARRWQRRSCRGQLEGGVGKEPPRRVLRVVCIKIKKDYITTKRRFVGTAEDFWDKGASRYVFLLETLT